MYGIRDNSRPLNSYLQILKKTEILLRFSFKYVQIVFMNSYFISSYALFIISGSFGFSISSNTMHFVSFSVLVFLAIFNRL